VCRFGSSVHDYQRPNVDIVRAIVADHLDDFLRFARIVLTQ
jgi:hypothetical protein